MPNPLLYELIVPILRRALDSQIAILKEAVLFCAENGVDDGTMMASRLVPDMFPLPFHIRFCAFVISNILVDLDIIKSTDIGPPQPNEETTFEHMIALQQSVVMLLANEANANAFDQKDTVHVDIRAGKKILRRITALEYLQEVALPSFWFHHTMIYAILRTKGVPLNKAIYLSGGEARITRAPGTKADA